MIGKYYRAIAFIPTYGGGKATIEECQYWEYEDELLSQVITDTHPDIKAHNLVCPDEKITREYLTKSVEDYSKIPFWKTKSKSKAPCAIEGDIPILKSLTMPACFDLGKDYDILDLPDKIETENDKINEALSLEDKAICEDIILSKIEPESPSTFCWEKHGAMLIDFVIKERIRTARFEYYIKVPVTSGSNWQLAKKVYAGKQNGGLEIDAMIANIDDRFILDGDADQNKDKFYKEIGVSYTLKILPVEHWKDISEQVINNIKAEYDSKRYAGYTQRSPYWKEKEYKDQYIEYFSEITNHLHHNEKNATNEICKIIHKEESRISKFAKFQIENTQWVKLAKTTLLHDGETISPNKTYLPNVQAIPSNIFPAIPVQNFIKEIGENDAIPFLQNTLCVKDELTKEADHWADYFEALKKYVLISKIAENTDTSQDEVKKRCKTFYKTYHDCLKDTNQSADSVIDILCTCNEELQFFPQKAAYYYDETFLNLDCLQKLSKNYPISIFEGDIAQQKRSEFFNITNLRDELEEPIIGKSCQDESSSKQVLAWLKDANFYLDKFFEAEDIKNIADTVNIVKGIRFKIKDTEEFILDQYYYDKQKETLYIEYDDNPEKILRKIARGIHKAYQSDICEIVRLRKDGDQKELQRFFRDWRISLNDDEEPSWTEISENEPDIIVDTSGEGEGTSTSQNGGTGQNSGTGQSGLGQNPVGGTAPNSSSGQTSSNSGSSNPATLGNKPVTPTPPKGGAGGGRGPYPSNPSENSKTEIEQEAVKRAINHYKEKGYKVISVENENKGWDLEATKNEDKLYIEVKGRRNSQWQIKMTENEYNKMQQHSDKYRLFINNIKGYCILKYQNNNIVIDKNNTPTKWEITETKTYTYTVSLKNDVV